MRELFREGVRWTVHEASASRTPGAKAYRCLIFDSEGIVRRLWVFPERWDQLVDDDILRLLDGQPDVEPKNVFPAQLLLTKAPQFLSPSVPDEDLELGVDHDHGAAKTRENTFEK